MTVTVWQLGVLYFCTEPVSNYTITKALVFVCNYSTYDGKISQSTKLKIFTQHTVYRTIGVLQCVRYYIVQRRAQGDV